MTFKDVNLITVSETGQVDTYKWEDVKLQSMYLDVTGLDEVVLDSIIELVLRSRLGLSKYGTKLQDNDVDDFLQHAKEEALDLANYLSKLQRDRGSSMLYRHA